MAQSVGQSDYESFFKVSHHMRNIALAMISIISLFLLVFAESVFSVLTKDGAVIDQLQQMLPILLIYIWVAAFETMNSTKLRANNDTLSSAIITTASLWVILIAGSYLSLNAWPSMGVKGPWMCTIVSSLFTLACFRYRFSTLSLAKAN
jgi:Na+-driven multidrug efflux pump